MSSGWQGERRFRFDGPQSRQGSTQGSARGETRGHARSDDDDFFPPPFDDVPARSPRLIAAIERTRDYLLSQQAPEGYWVGELEGDTILESEYILLLAYLGRPDWPTARRCSEYILKKQIAGGGWAIYPGGPLEVSASVKAYWALKLTGHSPQAPYMLRAQAAIRAAGGAERVNSFTRYYLALLGVISYEKCPAVPPEV